MVWYDPRTWWSKSEEPAPQTIGVPASTPSTTTSYNPYGGKTRRRRGGKSKKTRSGRKSSRRS